MFDCSKIKQNYTHQRLDYYLRECAKGLQRLFNVSVSLGYIIFQDFDKTATKDWVVIVNNVHIKLFAIYFRKSSGVLVS